MSRSTADSASSATLPTPKERRRLREALALSEEQVAEAMGVTKATVRSWETGRSTPRGRKREAYAKLLGTSGPADASAPSPPPDGADEPEQARSGPSSPVRPQVPAKDRPQAPSRDRPQPPAPAPAAHVRPKPAA
ncbi:helix-turn-helix domain-containing protein, partial [Streptomyces sp. NPDC001919]